MPADTSDETRGVCFVVMGFGKKTDFESGRTLDLDKTYRNIIEPAVKDAHLKCIRADDIVHSGVIDVWMYEQLLEADVVVADLSTANNNAFYEFLMIYFIYHQIILRTQQNNIYLHQNIYSFSINS